MSISGRARVAGVIGWPIAHSRSPRLHGYWLERYGIDGAYIPMGVAPDDLPAALRALAQLGLRGANVTVHTERFQLSGRIVWTHGHERGVEFNGDDPAINELHRYVETL